jgi:predicted nucleic acid-binding protein
MHGVSGSRDVAAADRTLRRFLAVTPVLDFTGTTAERGAIIRIELRRNKRQIHERALDILVAATAIEHNLLLVSRNLHHFGDISGLHLYRDPST